MKFFPLPCHFRCSVLQHLILNRSPRDAVHKMSGFCYVIKGFGRAESCHVLKWRSVVLLSSSHNKQCSNENNSGSTLGCCLQREALWQGVLTLTGPGTPPPPPPSGWLEGLETLRVPRLFAPVLSKSIFKSNHLLSKR
jgi:hypothetical protein